MKQFLALLTGVLFMSATAFGDCIIYGKVIDHNSHVLPRIQINIKTDQERIQKYTDPNGEFKIESKKLQYDEIIVLYITSKDYEPLDERDLTIRIKKGQKIEILLVPVGLINKREALFIKTAIAANAKQLQLGNDSSAEQLKKKQKNDSLAISASSLYVRSQLGKTPKNAKKPFELIKQGRADEATAYLNEDDDTTAIKQIEGRLKGWYDKAELYVSLYEYKKADEYYRRVLNYYSTNINYVKGYADFLIFSYDHPKEGIEMLNKINLDQVKDDSIKISIYNFYGAAYSDLGDNLTAYSYYTKELDLARNSKNISKWYKTKTACTTYNNIGTIYADHNDSIAVEYFVKGLSFLNKAVAEDKNLENIQSRILFNFNLGGRYKKRGNYHLAKNYYLEALKNLETSKDKTNFEIDYYISINENLADIAFTLDKTKHTIESGKPFLDSLQSLNRNYKNRLASKVFDLLYSQAVNYETLKEYDRAINDYHTALAILRINYADSSIDDNTNIALVYQNLARLMQAKEIQDSTGYYADSSRFYFLTCNTLIDFNLDNNSERYFTNKFGLYMNLAAYYNDRNDKQKQLKNLQDAGELINKMNLPDSLKHKKRIRLNEMLGNYYRFEREYENSYKYRTESVDIYENKIKNKFLNEERVAWLCRTAADEMYYYNDSFLSDSIQLLRGAIDNYSKAMEIYRQFYSQDSNIIYAVHIADIAYLQGLAYTRLNDTVPAQKLLLEALGIYKSFDPVGKVDIQGIKQVKSITYTLGQLEKQTNPTVFKYLFESLGYDDHLFRADPNSEIYKYNKAMTLNSIGIAFNEQGNKDSAIKYYNASLAVMESLPSINNRYLSIWMATREGIAYYFADINEPKKAIAIRMEHVYLLEEKLNLDSLLNYFSLGSAMTMNELYDQLARNYVSLNMYDSAVFYSKKMVYVLNKYNDNGPDANLKLNHGYKTLGWCQILNGQPDSALISLKTGLKNYTTPDHSYWRQRLIINMIFAYIFNDQLSKAKKMYVQLANEYSIEKANEFVESEWKDYENRALIHKDFSKFKEFVLNYKK